MKPCRAIAVALVGWYLLAPLVHHPEASIADWSYLGSYDTAKACTEARDKVIDRSQRTDFHLHGSTIQQTRNVLLESECIETDDPRLKGTGAARSVKDFQEWNPNEAAMPELFPRVQLRARRSQRKTPLPPVRMRQKATGGLSDEFRSGRWNVDCDWSSPSVRAQRQV
jgi:hypothetical protein